MNDVPEKTEQTPAQPQSWPIRLTFMPEKSPDGAPTRIRLRRLLKAARRYFSFRCLEVYTVDPEFAPPEMLPPRSRKKSRRNK